MLRRHEEVVMDEKEPVAAAPKAPETKAAAEEITCEACGATNTESDEVCRSCGEELWEEEGDEGAAPEGWKPLIIGGALAALVLGLFLWKPWVKAPAGGTDGGTAATGGGPTNEVHEIKQDGDVIWI